MVVVVGDVVGVAIKLRHKWHVRVSIVKVFERNRKEMNISIFSSSIIPSKFFLISSNR